MTTPVRKRPKRLWAAALLDILHGSVSLFAIVFLSISQQVPYDLRLTPFSGAVAGLSTGMMILWSILALCGIGWARYLMLVAAVLFFGSTIAQNVQLYTHAHDAAGNTMQLVRDVLVSAVPLGFNIWALLSARTRRFFDAAPTPAPATINAQSH